MDLRAYKKIIVFGGSFDPPHVAHVKLPGLVMRALAADAVAYVPTGQQPLKPEGAHASAEHRLAMLKLALKLQANVVVLTDEIDRGADIPSYTVDTLEVLRERLGEKVQTHLLIGADQLREFDKWRSWRRIIEIADPVVMLRKPQTKASLLSSLPAPLSDENWAPRIIELPRIDISSSQIRRRVAEGESIDQWVVTEVAEYIRRHGLYRE